MISFAIAPVVLLIVHLLKRRSGGAIANESTVQVGASNVLVPKEATNPGLQALNKNSVSNNSVLWGGVGRSVVVVVVVGGGHVC